MNIYERICKLCKANQTTITNLFLELCPNKSRGNMATWRKGHFTFSQIIAIAEKFNVTTDYLIKGTGAEKITAENTFYERIKRIANEKGTTLTAVAKDLKLSTSMPTNWKNGQLPAADTLLLLSSYFGVTTDYLLKGEDKGKTKTHMEKGELYFRVKKIWGKPIDELEKKAGISQGAISKWRTSYPRVDNLMQVVEVIGCSYDCLLKKEYDETKTMVAGSFNGNNHSQNVSNSPNSQQSQNNTNKETAKTIDRILKLMEQKNVSAHKLEVEAGLSNASIQAWKKGKAQASIVSLQKIADYFGVSINYILYGKENEFTEKEKQLIEAIKSLSDSEVDKLNDFVAEIIKRK